MCRYLKMLSKSSFLVLKSFNKSLKTFLVASGDMRRAVNFLQSLHRLHEDEITPDDVRDVAILCPPAKIDEVIREARNKSYDNMLSKVHALLQVKDLSFFCF